MQTISTEKAREILSPLGLGIGAWNEVIDLQVLSENFMYQPPRLANELYVFCRILVQWISFQDWILIQIDNSTSPLEDEVDIMENIFAMSVSDKADANTSFVMDGSDSHSKLAMLMFFAIIFEWHVHIVSASSKDGKRLGLQDGVVYFFGSSYQMKDARAAVAKFESSPLVMQSGGQV